MPGPYPDARQEAGDHRYSRRPDCNSARRTACFYGSTVPAAAKSVVLLWFVCWQKLVAARYRLLAMAYDKRTKEQLMLHARERTDVH